MSIRVDTVSLISGAIVCGNRGLGVLGSLIPATGDNGPGYTYNDLSLPADNDKEICGRITTWPTNGTLTAYEDTSFEYSGTTDTFQYQLYVDGVAVGSPTTVMLQVGDATAQFTITADDAVFSGSASTSSVAEAIINAIAADAVFYGGASSLGAMTLSGADLAAITNAVLSALCGNRTLSEQLQVIAATLVGETTGAGTSHITFADGAVTVEADVPLPGEVGDRTNVTISV